MIRENLLDSTGAVIYNPTAGRGHGAQKLAEAQSLLGERFVWIPTARPGHAIDLAREAASKHPVVVAFGGDGTVGDVVRGIYGTDATLGILPVGTGNDVARNVGVPLDLQEACATVVGGTVRRIDVGLLNDTPFVNNAGTGFDSRVMITMNHGIRFMRGRPAFLAAILKTVLTFPPFRMTLTIDGEAHAYPDALLLSILNGKVYGAGMPAAPHAEVDDGKFDVLVIKNLPKVQRLGLLTSLQSGNHLNHRCVEMYQAREIKVETGLPQPVNIDGEVRGFTPFTIKVMPSALKVLVR